MLAALCARRARTTPTPATVRRLLHGGVLSRLLRGGRTHACCGRGSRIINGCYAAVCVPVCVCRLSCDAAAGRSSARLTRLWLRQVPNVGHTGLHIDAQGLQRLAAYGEVRGHGAWVWPLGRCRAGCTMHIALFARLTRTLGRGRGCWGRLRTEQRRSHMYPPDDSRQHPVVQSSPLPVPAAVAVHAGCLPAG